MNVLLRRLGVVDYEACWRAMRAFTDNRTAATTDELWAVEHPPVFTLGRAGRQEHVLAAGDIPVIRTDRGGQVTYHGPGQLVVYTLLDVRRLAIGPRELVRRLEASVIAFLADRGVTGQRRAGAPGVYVDGAKLAALGLRIRGPYSYHGLALNVDLELEPFRRINPCGYAGLQVTRLADLGIVSGCAAVFAQFAPFLTRCLYGVGPAAAAEEVAVQPDASESRGTAVATLP